MNFLKHLLPLFLIVLITACSQTVDYEILSRRIESQTCKQLKKEKDLIAAGNSGQMMGDIQSIGLSFQYYHIINLEEARELLVYATEVFLKNINENKEIRPYLHEYPFTAKNIEISIFIYQPNRCKPNQGSLAFLCMRDGILRYELVAPKKYAPWPVLHEETYETGLEILAGKS